MDFGVSQRQIVKIIKLLSLEIEDRELMSRIVKSISDLPSDSSLTLTKQIDQASSKIYAGGNSGKLKIR
jgi:hypothetical protein